MATIFDVLFKCAYPETDKSSELDVNAYGTGYTDASSPHRRVDTSHVPQAYKYQQPYSEEVILKTHHMTHQESGTVMLEEDKRSVKTGFTGMTGRWARGSTGSTGLQAQEAPEKTPELVKEDASFSVQEEDKESVKEADKASVKEADKESVKEADKESVKEATPEGPAGLIAEFDATPKDCRTQRSAGLSTVKSYVFDVSDDEN